MNRLECLAITLSEDGKFRPITIFLYLNELADNCGVSRACDCMCDNMDPRLVLDWLQLSHLVVTLGTLSV